MSRALVIFAVVAAALCALGFIAAPRDMLVSWLFAWLFVLGLSLGSMALLMLHELTGGPWGPLVVPPLAAAMRLLPALALAWVPLGIGMGVLYPWVGAPLTAHHGGWWLNPPFFIARSIGYLLAWILVSRAWLRASPPTRAAWSAAGLIVYTLTVSLAAVDWIASLMPTWYSSGFGLVVATGQMLGALAMAVAAAAWSHYHERPQGEARQSFIDLGNLLLSFVLTWAYLAFVQFLVIWMGNLPREIAWYVPRLQAGWAWIAVLLVLFHFFVPLFLLLFRRAKALPRSLFALAAALFVVHLVDCFWLVVPSIRTDGFRLAWTDLLAPIVLVVGWFAAWRRALADPPHRLTAELLHG